MKTFELFNSATEQVIEIEAVDVFRAIDLASTVLLIDNWRCCPENDSFIIFNERKKLLSDTQIIDLYQYLKTA